MPAVCRVQERLLDSLELKWQMVGETIWALRIKLALLENQTLLLIAEPSLQPLSFFLPHFLLFFFLDFQDRVSLCSPDCPGTGRADQAGLELRDLPASAPGVLGLKAGTARSFFPFLKTGSGHKR